MTMTGDGSKRLADIVLSDLALRILRRMAELGWADLDQIEEEFPQSDAAIRELIEAGFLRPAQREQ